MLRKARRARPTPVRCASCGAEDAIRIDLTLPDGGTVEFSSCHRCEHRWWTSDGSVIDLTQVLDRVRRT